MPGRRSPARRSGAPAELTEKSHVWGFEASSFQLQKYSLLISGADKKDGIIIIFKIASETGSAYVLARMLVDAEPRWIEVPYVDGGKLFVKREENVWMLRQEVNGGFVNAAVFEKPLVMLLIEELEPKWATGWTSPGPLPARSP